MTLALQYRSRARILGLAALVIMVAVWIFAPAPASAGWLIAFATIASIMFGSAALLLIHVLTGGRWGEIAHPALAGAAALIPLALACFIPVAATAGAIYPWAQDAHSAGPDVAALYLNTGFFSGRGLIFTAGLALIGYMAASSRLRPITAGLGLVWYAVGMNFIAVDWLMSIEPRYTSSAFGAQIIIEQMVAALAFAILATQADESDPAWGDLGALLLATLLGETYLILMTFLIQWYGNLPDQAEWYLRRTRDNWFWLELTGAVVGSFAPLLSLLFSRVRNSASTLRVVGVAALLGVFLENLWLVAPLTGLLSAAAALLAMTAIGGLAVGYGDVVEALQERKATTNGV